MPYQISREGQLYGPYTLEDLQRYVASGNVLLTDMAKSEEMPDWLPVSQILSTAGAAAATAVPTTPPSYVPPAYTPPGAPAYTPAAGTAYPDPPNLHWALVLLFGLFTCGLFFVIWDFVQVRWAKQVEPATKAMLYFILYVITWALYYVSYLTTVLPAAVHDETPRISPVTGLMGLVMFVFIILYRFTMKATLEQHFNGPEPIGLRLSGIMTFFFGGLYFQYHLSRINQIKQSARYRGY
ncbi:MAG TPA: DUF4339 domain-containing protein [Edaphobacter sp.]